MKKSNFALRLSPSLMDEAKKIAEAEGVAVNQLINIAIAEKVSALRALEEPKEFLIHTRAAVPAALSARP